MKMNAELMMEVGGVLLALNKMSANAVIAGLEGPHDGAWMEAVEAAHKLNWEAEVGRHPAGHIEVDFINPGHHGCSSRRERSLA